MRITLLCCTGDPHPAAKDDNAGVGMFLVAIVLIPVGLVVAYKVWTRTR